MERRADLPFVMAFEALLRCGGNMVIPGTGENARRYAKEKAAFIEKYGGLIQKGDPFYNPHFNLLFENYGLK